MYNMYKCVFDRPKNKLVAFVTMTACCTQVPRGKTKKKKKNSHKHYNSTSPLASSQNCTTVRKGRKKRNLPDTAVYNRLENQITVWRHTIDHNQGCSSATMTTRGVLLPSENTCSAAYKCSRRERETERERECTQKRASSTVHVHYEGPYRSIQYKTTTTKG